MLYSVGSVTQLSHPRPDVFLSQGRAGKPSREHLKTELIKHRLNCVSVPHAVGARDVCVCVCVCECECECVCGRLLQVQELILNNVKVKKSEELIRIILSSGPVCPCLLFFCILFKSISVRG